MFWHGYVLHKGTAYQGRVPRISQMTSRLLRHTAAAIRAHNVLCNGYNSITVERLSSGYFPGVWVLKADVSEHCVGSIFNRWSPVEDGTDTVFRNVGF
jgi:hypothetical protein